MARKKIREYNSKRLLQQHFSRLAGRNLPLEVAQVKADTCWTELLAGHPWLAHRRLVVKPDCLFGKRGKHDLVGLNLDHHEAKDFISKRMDKIVDMDGIVGKVWICLLVIPLIFHPFLFVFLSSSVLFPFFHRLPASSLNRLFPMTWSTTSAFSPSV
jgi:ATP citrate (pro-S)-lyase